MERYQKIFKENKLPKIGSTVVYVQSNEKVKVIKVKTVKVDRDLKGKKLTIPYTDYLITVEFPDEERQTTDLSGIKF